MGIPRPERALTLFPHQFSGGMRQRVMLAMGFANEPALLIADEPTTALDVTIQAQILDLLRALNADLGTAVILISHDLGVIANICSRVLVMYAGEVVEEGAPEDLLTDPRHPYTWALLHAAPRIDRRMHGDRRLTTIEGQPPDPRAWPDGLPVPRPLPVRGRCLCAASGAAAGRRGSCSTLLGDAGWRHVCIRRSCPRPSPTRGRALGPTPLLDVRGLAKHFELPRDSFLDQRRVLRAVDGVDLDVFPGETVGLVGESGCGKSTLARVVMRLDGTDRGTRSCSTARTSRTRARRTSGRCAGACR